jgi:hypothetical protein
MATSDIATVQPFLELLQLLDETGKNELLNSMRKKCNDMVRDALSSVNDSRVDMVGDNFW